MRHVLMIGLLWLCQDQISYAATPLVELAPVQASTENLVLIFPGGKVAPQQYQVLAAAIDKASQGRVAVVAAGFSANLPNPIQADARINSAIDLLKAAGVTHPESHIYLVGHSDGGIMGHGPAAKHRLAGLILLGSYIPNAVIFGGSLADYALPVLMMMGDRDGHTGVNFLARELLRLPADIAAWKKSVLLIQGANHMQMADGSAVSEDLVATASLQMVHAQVARNMVDFIDAQGESSRTQVSSARDNLAKQQQATKLALKPFADTWTRHETLCADSVIFAETAVKSGSILFKKRGDFAAFLAAMPKIERFQEGVPSYKVPTYIEPPLDPFDISINRYVAPPAIACKYFGTDPDAGVDLSESGDSCATLNMKAVSEAMAAIAASDLGGDYQSFRLGFEAWSWSKASDAAAENGWNFGPITLVSRRADSLLQWLGAPVKWERSSTNRWQLEVSHWRSEDGITHCKLIAPLKLVEWATTLLPKELDASRRAARLK